jgi:hypothetical protein
MAQLELWARAARVLAPRASHDHEPSSPMRAAASSQSAPNSLEKVVRQMQAIQGAKGGKMTRRASRAAAQPAGHFHFKPRRLAMEDDDSPPGTPAEKRLQKDIEWMVSQD